jgi:hypothetical protein
VKSQTGAELTGHIFIAASHVKNGSTMLGRGPASLLKSKKICLKEESGHLEQLDMSLCH